MVFGMKTLDFRPGTHIDAAIAYLVDHAPARTEFNGVWIRARYATTKAVDVAARYQRLCEDRSYRFRTSPEGRRQTALGVQDIATKQATVDRMLLALPDFTDPAVVIDWCAAFVDATDRMGVRFDHAARRALVATFAAHGWHRGVYCDERFDEHDARIYAWWIVGQVMDGYAQSSPAPNFIARFARLWRERFVPQDAQPAAFAASGG